MHRWICDQSRTEFPSGGLFLHIASQQQGYITASPGQTSYTKCPDGFVTGAPGATKCDPCPPASAAIGPGSCGCLAGFAGALSGANGSCAACGAGSFQPLSDSAATVCVPCRGNSSTPAWLTAATDASQCQCVEGFFSDAETGECKEAPPVRKENN